MVVLVLVKNVWNPRRTYTNTIEGMISKLRRILNINLISSSLILIRMKVIMIWVKAKANMRPKHTRNK